MQLATGSYVLANAIYIDTTSPSYILATYRLPWQESKGKCDRFY